MWCRFDGGKLVRTDDLIQAEDPPSLEDVVNVKERTEPASILDGAVIPKRRLHEKTSLSRLSVQELQDRLLRGQAWANEEFSRLESNLEDEDGGVTYIYDLDCENNKIENLAQEHAVSCKRLEVDPTKEPGEDEELFLQTRTISLKQAGSEDSSTLDSVAQDRDRQLR